MYRRPFPVEALGHVLKKNGGIGYSDRMKDAKRDYQDHNTLGSKDKPPHVTHVVFNGEPDLLTNSVLEGLSVVVLASFYPSRLSRRLIMASSVVCFLSKP